MNASPDDTPYMQQSLRLARQGEGRVEPNPMVGCVIVRDGSVVGEGWHRQFGGPHAEVEAIVSAGKAAEGATLYVTLEPCCHHGKTPPCTVAIQAAGIRRVVVAQQDPFPLVAGEGLGVLQRSGLKVEVGLLEAEANDLNAPYLKRLATGRPWVIAKWAMTLDGKIASRTGNSQWISNPASRHRAHELRGKMDAIIVGRGTAEADNPQLTARPPGPRTALRIVMDSMGRISDSSALVQSAAEVPVLVAVSEQSDNQQRERLAKSGAEVLVCIGESHAERLTCLLAELGARQMTNILVEGGSGVLGTLRDANLIDEVHVFLAANLVGGDAAKGPCGGAGAPSIDAGLQLKELNAEMLDGDLHIWGRVK